jgi:hypothetical protein
LVLFFFYLRITAPHQMSKTYTHLLLGTGKTMARARHRGNHVPSLQKVAPEPEARQIMDVDKMFYRKGLIRRPKIIPFSDRGAANHPPLRRWSGLRRAAERRERLPAIPS